MQLRRLPRQFKRNRKRDLGVLLCDEPLNGRIK